jgi:putative lipoprotein
MSSGTGIPIRAWARVALASILVLIANAARAQSIDGTATYRERMALPANAVFEATLEDVSRTDAPAVIVAIERISSPGNPPIAFTITYDSGRIAPDHRYVVRGKILVDGALLFTSDTAVPVLTRGSPATVSLLLRRASASQTASSGKPLTATYWKAVELAGKPTPAQAGTREVHLQFQVDGRVSGFDGCNQMTGPYTLSEDRLTFGRMAATQMACMNTSGTEQAFRAALEHTSRFRIDGDKLELFDDGGVRLAVFQARQ